jgi:transposase
LGVRWPLPDDLDDRRLEELFFSAGAGRPSKSTRVLPDFAEVRHQLHAHKHLTLQLVWEEYRETQPDGYGYSPLLRAVSALE